MTVGDSVGVLGILTVPWQAARNIIRPSTDRQQSLETPTTPTRLADIQKTLIPQPILLLCLMDVEWNTGGTE